MKIPVLLLVLAAGVCCSPLDRCYPALGYEYHTVGYYKYHEEPLTWNEARKLCHTEGGYLAIINSEAEHAILLDMMKKFPATVLRGVKWVDNAFIGFHDLFQEGEYVAIDGTPLAETGFYRWDPNAPYDRKQLQNCGSLFRKGGISDTYCNDPSPFICELNCKVNEIPNQRYF